MRYLVRSMLRQYVRPPLLRLYRRVAGGVRFSGKYASWEEAGRHSIGYDSREIIERVTEAALKVKRGEAVFERDAVLFDEMQYSWPVLAGLMWIAAQRNSRLNIVDFGGSLGSSYFQARKFLAGLQECRWNIVEQKEFVTAGKKYFANNSLRFYENLDECMANEQTDAILLSSVIQYLPQPHGFLADVMQRGFQFILIDRTPFSVDQEDWITIQHVPPSIYPASYPAWILNKDRFKASMGTAYDLIAEYDSPDTANAGVVFNGFIYRKKETC